MDQNPGRDFYPYERIQVIRQRPVDVGDGSDEDETAGEAEESAVPTMGEESVEE